MLYVQFELRVDKLAYEFGRIAESGGSIEKVHRVLPHLHVPARLGKGWAQPAQRLRARAAAIDLLASALKQIQPYAAHARFVQLAQLRRRAATPQHPDAGADRPAAALRGRCCRSCGRQRQRRQVGELWEDRNFKQGEAT